MSVVQFYIYDAPLSAAMCKSFVQHRLYQLKLSYVPPGGASSFSLGDGSGSAPQRASRMPAPRSLGSSTQHDIPPNPYLNKNPSTQHDIPPNQFSHKTVNTEHDDVGECRIPGLEDHYKGRKLQGAAQDAGELLPRSMAVAQGKLAAPQTSQQIYASQLKQQIEDKMAIQAAGPQSGMQQIRSARRKGSFSDPNDMQDNIGGSSNDSQYDRAMQLYKDSSSKQQAAVAKPNRRGPTVAHDLTVQKDDNRRNVSGARAQGMPPTKPKGGQSSAEAKPLRTSVSVSNPPGVLTAGVLSIRLPGTYSIVGWYPSSSRKERAHKLSFLPDVWMATISATVDETAVMVCFLLRDRSKTKLIAHGSAEEFLSVERLNWRLRVSNN
eukprot:gene2289-4452_t